MVKFENCQLNNIHFINSKLLGINFSECVSQPFIVNMRGSILDYCSFEKKKMAKTAFLDCSMKNVDFTETDLTKAIFANTDLLNAIFYQTVLKEANFLTAFNFSIDPEANALKKAKFSLSSLPGLLNKYQIIIE